MEEHKAQIADIISHNWLIIVLCLGFLIPMLIFMREDLIFSFFTFISIWFILFLPFAIPYFILKHKRLNPSQVALFFIYMLPWYLAVLIYENLGNFTSSLTMPLMDIPLYHIDVLIFGETPSLILQNYIHPTLTYLLFLVYLFGYVIPPLVLAIMLWVTKRKEQFLEYSHAFVICMYIGFLFYLLVPAVGPKVYYADSFDVDVYGNTVLSTDLMGDIQRYNKNVFPSMHTALSTLVLLFSRKYGGKLFYLILPIAILVWFSTIYLRMHYFVDLLAGWSLALMMFYLAPSILSYARKVGESRIRPDIQTLLSFL